MGLQTSLGLTGTLPLTTQAIPDGRRIPQPRMENPVKVLHSKPDDWVPCLPLPKKGNSNQSNPVENSLVSSHRGSATCQRSQAQSLCFCHPESIAPGLAASLGFVPETGTREATRIRTGSTCHHQPGVSVPWARCPLGTAVLSWLPVF